MTNNLDWTDGTARNERLRRYFSPSLDIYFQKKFAHRQNLSLDVVGTYFKAGGQFEDEDLNNVRVDQARVEELMAVVYKYRETL